MPHNNLSFDVVILGAGAAGLFCALTAAKRGRSVLVLEKANKVGKKILMSGGGRCNFTNLYIEPEHYICSNPHFVKSALTRYTQWDFIALVEQHGIVYEERSHQQLFCVNSARDILDMLLKECALANVQIQTHTDSILIMPVNAAQDPIDNQRQSSNRYEVTYNHQEEHYCCTCDSLVIATGALSIPTLGGSDLGYKIAQQFNLPLIDRRPGLVPFMFSDAMKELCETLSGLSLEVSVSCREQRFREHMLFTHRGISGPAILQISNYWHPSDTLCINLLPDKDATAFLLGRKKTTPKSHLKKVLSETLAKSLAHELQKHYWPDLGNIALAEIGDQQLKKLAKLLNAWSLKPAATEGYRTAEVTLGGIDTHAISSKNMEVKQHPGLFFIGEVLDVTGHLGGYNFQWAWSSGYSAGLVV